VPADRSTRFFTYSYEVPALSEWTVSATQIASKTLHTPPEPNTNYNWPNALALTTLDDTPVVVGVGPYSTIYIWNARDGTLQDSVQLEQAHQMALLP